MTRFSPVIAVILFVAGGFTMALGQGRTLKDLYFGEALYYASQGEYFDAISRLDTELGQYYGLDEPDLDSLHYHIGEAEFSVGDFELYYRMHNRAGRAIKAVIEGDVTETVRNEAIYRLAKIFYQKQQPLNAFHTIERLRGEIPDRLRYEEPFLRAQIYIENGKFSDAIELLKDIENAEGMKGFAGYNLGIAMLKSGMEEEGLRQLDKVGQNASTDESVEAVRDKANLVLGYRLLENGEPDKAKQYLDRVRVKGPFSNKALLGSGRAAVAGGKFDRALAPWTILLGRNVTDESVQEVMMGVPYAYGKLEAHGRSAILYGQALEGYGREIDRLDSSIASIRKGKFLEALVREEFKADRDWLINLRNLPEAPETYYLAQLMASNDFQESLKNYFDLSELQKKMASWDGSLDAYEQIISIRAGYYEPLLPGIEKTFRELDSLMKMRIQQRDRIDSRLEKMLINARPDFLATKEERILLQKIHGLEEALAEVDDAAGERSRKRLARLRGVLKWDIAASYQDRFTEAYEHLHALDSDVEKLKEAYRSFVRTRQAATLSYKGYDKQIKQLRIKIRQSQEQIKILMARQGHLIEVMAVGELEKRRQRLEEYQVKARFALAESYDRASKAQQERKYRTDDNGSETEKPEEKNEEGVAVDTAGTGSQDRTAEARQSDVL